MMNYNYHAHTYRCGHATGEDEDYVIRAINGGIKYMGFSDHAPFVFPDGYESHYRVKTQDIQSYFDSLGSIREKYKDKIEIKIGFEMEYYPEHFEKMLKNAKNIGAEYLILGQHYIGNEHPDTYASTKKTDSEELLSRYVDCVCSAVDSGVFTYVAHPDIINFVGNDNIFRKEMSRICEVSKQSGIPLEINFLGIRKGRHYPNPKFWEIAGEAQCPVTFGCDAHDPIDAFDEKSLSVAEWLVRRYKLNYIGMPKIIELN
ncbi:MAG: histidinol-phosphatase [Clostridia bacterium]|nr:histidinol-phosphatase [Clostridia bacterium]